MVLVIALALTVLGTFYIVRTGRIRDELRFGTAADAARYLIDIRLQTYVEVLRAGVALFGASDHVTRAEFHAFVSRLRLPERYPGIQGVGFALRVPPDDTDVPVWPPGPRDDYTSIQYLEPMNEANKRALGFDMFSEPVRRAAMERARDIGEPAASGIVTLVQESDGEHVQAGFLIYVPVYRNGVATSTVEERRDALYGYVYSPFRADDLLRGILGSTGPEIALDLFDGPIADPASLMHSAPRSWSPSRDDELRVTYPLDVAGRTWTLVFTGQEHFDGLSPIWLAPLTFAGGVLVSFALFAILTGQYRARETAEQHAAQLRASEEALRASESRLRRLVVLEREARAEAQAADRAKDEFLATLSHELRTPLNAMLGWISMLRAGQVREERRAAALEVVERNARTQARLIEDLLDVSRIITGKVRLDPHPLQLGPIAHTVVEALRPGAEAKGVRLEAEIDPKGSCILGDAARLQQVFWNLLSNAIKFTPPGGLVRLELKEAPDGITLRVRDTGIGIDPWFLPHVFERFRQADSSLTRTHGGVGLGLAIVRHLVELHGGRISAHSEGRERGAEFVVELPAARQEGNAIDDRDSLCGVALDSTRVLVVDDDADTREMLTESLLAAGADVLTAGSADDAIALLQSQGADVLVSDIGMPGADGYTLMRRVRAISGAPGRIPALALTAYARPEDRATAIEAGFQFHLAKPVDIDALLSAVGRIKAAATIAHGARH